ncbi:MAG TPA: hypothetical protein PLG59_00635 [bacterium]|nr:hypothetical protein [bacterium]
MQSLVYDTKIDRAAASAVAGTTTITGSIFDMADFESCVFAVLGCHVAASGNYIKVEQGAESDLSDAADLEGSKVVCTVADNLVGVEIKKPTDRYLRAWFFRGTSTAVEAMICIRHGARKLPVTNSGEGDWEFHASPAEGTA